MARGDHIFVKRLGYSHHGIDTGDGTVIHYTGEVGQKAGAAVRQTVIAEFASGAQIQVREYGQCDRPDKVIRRAERRLTEAKYNLAFNNCEHFATWCKTGRHRSEQVNNTKGAGGAFVGAGSTIAGGIGVVSATGAAAGLSGPGVMSGLAYIGGIVGGGVVAGITVLGTAPALASAAAMHYVLKDDVIHHNKEREARRTGRISSIIGASLGSTGSITTVALAGTAGLSGAGITSGLAAVGSIVGGGMVSGVVITAAAPAVAAAAVGYGAYKLHQYFRSNLVIPGGDKPTAKDAMTEKEPEEQQPWTTITKDKPE
jgi:hypothetical protein